MTVLCYVLTFSQIRESSAILNSACCFTCVSVAREPHFVE